MLIDFSCEKMGKYRAEEVKIVDLIGKRLYNAVDHRGKIIHRNCVFIPRKIDGCVVTEIGEGAFSPNYIEFHEQDREIREKIECVYLPDTIRKIENNAFFNCTMLKDVYAPGESEIKISKFLSDGNLQSDGTFEPYDTFQADYIFPTLEICQSDVILQHVHPFTGCDPYLTIHHSDNTSWKSFCWDEDIRSDDTLQQQGIYHDQDYKSTCERRYNEFALHNNLAYLGISDDRTDIQIPLGERPYKVFRKKIEKTPIEIYFYAWVFTHFIWIKLQIGEFNAVDMPYSPYTNAHPKYLSNINKALCKYCLSIRDPKNLREKYNHTETFYNNFQELENFFHEAISEILSRPFIGIKDYLDLVKETAEDEIKTERFQIDNCDFEWRAAILDPEDIRFLKEITGSQEE